MSYQPVQDPEPPQDPLVLLGLYVQRSRSLEAIGQRLLAARADVSQSAVARLEVGRAGGMPTRRLVDIGEVLGRSFPLGVCPHDHRCAWQPIEPPPLPGQQNLYREMIIARGLDSLPRWMRD